MTLARYKSKEPKAREHRKAKSQEQKSKECQRGIRSVIYPKDKKQEALLDSILNYDITVIKGPAGSGKTLLSIYQLYNLLKSHYIDKIYIVRLISECYDEKIGALPGELEDKLDYYTGPIRDNLAEFLPQGEIDYLFKNKQIEIIPVSYCRGRSFNNKGIIIEESQNLTPKALLTILTRIGRGTKLVFNGDDAQTDFLGRSGMSFLHALLDGIPETNVVTFGNSQVVRHPIITHILDRVNSLGDRFTI